MRDDLRGRLAPRPLAAFLVRRFGRNDFGEPNFRLVWGWSRVERSGGLWRGRELGMRWLPKYAEDAWIVEAWRPARCYGSPEQWYAPLAAGGTRMTTTQGTICLLGDYPSRGDYEDIGARMTWTPTERHLEAAVGAWRRGLDAPASLAQRVAARNAGAARAEERRDRAFDREAAAILGDGELAFYGAPMAGFGPKRRPAVVTLAEQAGIREHPF